MANRRLTEQKRQELLNQRLGEVPQSAASEPDPLDDFTDFDAPQDEVYPFQD